jgi:hypothetical protein
MLRYWLRLLMKSIGEQDAAMKERPYIVLFGSVTGGQ